MTLLGIFLNIFQFHMISGHVFWRFRQLFVFNNSNLWGLQKNSCISLIYYRVPCMHCCVVQCTCTWHGYTVMIVVIDIVNPLFTIAVNRVNRRSRGSIHIIFYSIKLKCTYHLNHEVRTVLSPAPRSCATSNITNLQWRENGRLQYMSWVSALWSSLMRCRI
jgi:hypothetical protein